VKSINSTQWLRRCGLFCASAALSFAVLSTWFNPTKAETKSEMIAQRMLELQESDERWIQVDVSRQRLIAWEGGTPVYAVIISSGKPETPTRTGTFIIKSKHRSTRMQGANYDVPNVPYAMYYQRGYAIHGAYWHRKFGTPVSHGCVNVAVNHSKWLFEWASVGTPVVIND